MKILALVALFLVPLLSLRAEDQKILRVGGLFDLTGEGAIWGKAEKNSFLLACRDFERENPGYSVETKIEDSMFSSKQTVTGFKKLSSIDRFQYIVGPTWETATPMMPLCEAQRVVCLIPSFHGKEWYARPWRYSFTAWFDDREYTNQIAKRTNERKYPKVAVFATITPYYDTLVENFQALSVTKPSPVERVMLEERDFRSMIGKVPSDVGAVVMLLSNSGQIQAFLKQWSELRNDRPHIYSDDSVTFLDPPEDLKRYGFTIFYSHPIFDETRLEQFKERYRSTYNANPEAASASVTYDETMILLNCAKRDQSSTAVRECVAATTDYPGYSGNFSFNGNQTVSGRTMGLKEL